MRRGGGGGGGLDSLGGSRSPSRQEGVLGGGSPNGPNPLHNAASSILLAPQAVSAFTSVPGAVQEGVGEEF